MPTLIYPASLPEPVEWRQQRVERRQMRDTREPANANRIRSREIGLNATASWVYEPGAMAVWKAWYEGALAAQAGRLRFWSARLPGQGGPQMRTARYMAPPLREYMGAGIWRVSASLYVRGDAVEPQQGVSVTDPGGFELREDGSRELREDASNELRG